MVPTGLACGAVLLDASQLDDGARLDADVCVVGGGPAGITVAEALSRSGRDVLVLESGGLQPDRAGRDLCRGESVGLPYYPLEQTRVRAVGGTSHDWPLELGWRVRPLDPVDLESGRGRGAGWPFAFDVLDRYYPAATRRCGLEPASYDPARWVRPGTPLLPADGRTAETVIFRYSTSDFTAASLLGAAHARIAVRATAVELRRRDAAAPVDAVVAATAPGRTFLVRPRIVVLAAGGIENARLLLASTHADPNGLGNRHDVVGRYFMERLTFRSGVLVPNDPNLLRRLGLYAIHPVDGCNVQGALHPRPAVLRTHELTNVAFFVEPRDLASASEGIGSLAALLHVRDRRPRPSRLVPHVRAVVRDRRAVTRTAFAHLARRWRAPEVLLLRAQAEPTPWAASRVTLGSGRDHLGQRRPRVDWRVRPGDIDAVLEAQSAVARALEAAGTARLLPRSDEAPEPLVDGAHHHLGTTRMSLDPSTGVVDADCRVHGVPNLYVAGSSTFPTAGFANPTLTVVALALRLADHLAARHRR